MDDRCLISQLNMAIQRFNYAIDVKDIDESIYEINKAEADIKKMEGKVID